MEPKINYTIVGLFVIILLSAFILGIVWLSSGVTTKQYNTYQINMNESVDGLTQSAPIEYNGVVVGNVKSISLNPTNPRQVIVLLNIQQGTLITTNTVATLLTQGLTRISYIGLRSTNGSLVPLQAQPGEPYPVIPTSPSLYVRIDNAVTEFTHNFNQLSANLNAFLNDENRRAFSQTLLNLDQVTATMADNTKELDASLKAANEILHNTAVASQQFSPLIKSSQNTMRTLNGETLPLANQVLNTLQSASNNLLEVSRTVKQNPSILLRGKTPAPPGPGEK